MLEANSKKHVRLCQTSRILFEGREEGMGFRIPSMDFSVNPKFRPMLLSSAHLYIKFSQGISVPTLAIAPPAFSFSPSAVTSPSLFTSYNVFICFPLS